MLIILYDPIIINSNTIVDLTLLEHETVRYHYIFKISFPYEFSKYRQKSYFVHVISQFARRVGVILRIKIRYPGCYLSYFQLPINPPNFTH